jgi:molybdenum cofactor cytidylyltransferase
LDLGGKPILRHVVDAALASSLDQVVLVLGHAAEEIASLGWEDGRLRVARNDRYASGQSTSLIAGLTAADPNSTAAVVLLGDQPGIRADAIDSVIRAWRNRDGRVVQASYGTRPGHPALFARSIWPVLRRVTGDEGARGILDQHPDWRSLVEVGGDPPDDIDTEEDYARVRAIFAGP